MSTRSPKKRPPTPAQILFEGKEILNERPTGMDFTEYRLLRAYQSNIIKKLFRHKPSRKIAQSMPTRIGYNQHLR
jgi:hypothetical protein